MWHVTHLYVTRDPFICGTTHSHMARDFFARGMHISSYLNGMHISSYLNILHTSSYLNMFISLHISISSYLLQVPTLEFLDTDTGETVCLSQSMAIMVFLENAFPSSGLPLLGYFSLSLSLSLARSVSLSHTLTATLYLQLCLSF